MNKKFLSAILFGALMVTSTGTFVSCKDYDDDIDRIDNTLNDLKSQIAALQSKVESGNYVTGVSKTAEGIVFTFSNGSTTPIAIKDGAQGEPGKDGSIVTVEDGVLCIDGEPTEIKVPEDAPVTEFKPAMKVENGEWAVLQADGTYKTTGIPVSPVTVKGNDATGFELTVRDAEGNLTVVKLPTANSVLDSASSVQGTGAVFESVTGGTDISWGFAGTANNWAGPLGKIAKNQLLVGQIGQATIKVKPVTYDLSAQTLKLVDNQGNVAPVVVTAVADGNEWITAPGPASARAASKTGTWLLNIEMASSVTKDNIENAFQAKVGSEYKNKLYALTVNGKAVTDYDYQIKIGTQNTTSITYNASNVKINGKDVATSYDLGKKHTVSYVDANVADAYLSLTENEKVNAEVWGVEVKGMTVTASKAASGKTLNLTLNLLGTNGTSTTGTISMTFGTSTVDTEITLPATTYTLNVKNKAIDINLGTVFSGLSAAEFSKLGTTFTLAEAANQQNFLLSALNLATYHKAKDDGSIGDAVTVSQAVDAKVIKYLRLPVEDNVATDAKAGNYTLKLTLKDTEGNEMKKVVIPVTIALPSFNDLYAKSASGNWNGSTFTAKLMSGKKVNLSNAFNAKDNNAFSQVTVAVAKVNDKQMVTDGAVSLTNDGDLLLTNDIINNRALRTSTLAAEASYAFYGVDDLKVSTKFTIDLHSQFEAPKLVYYVNNEAKAVATVGANNEIATLKDNEDDGVKNGLAIQYGRGEQPFIKNAIVDGVKLADTSQDNEVKVETTIKDVANAKAEMKDGNVTVSENKGTLVATFTDVNGIVTTATIAFE